MPPGRHAAGRLLAALCLAATAPLRAQVPDTTVADTTRARQPPPPDPTGILLQSQEESKVTLPGYPRPGREHLLPATTRVVLPRDSIEYRNAETVSDILATLDGVYVWRGGWVGRAEQPNYFDRGSTSVEYLVDGLPLVAMGRDSVSVDPSLLPLSLIERIEVERLPGLLRVHLMLRNHELLPPRTRVGIGRGNFEQARYEGSFEKRFRSGLGMALAAEFLVNPRGGRSFEHSTGWFQLDYVPSPRFGIQARYMLHDTDREAELSRETSDTLTRAVVGGRSALTFRATARSRDDGLGYRLDVLAGRDVASWDDSLRTGRWQGGMMLSRRGEDYSVGLSALYGDRWARLDTRARAGWTPLARLTVGVEGAYQTFDADRSAEWVLGRVGLRLPFDTDLAGSWRVGETVARPSIATDSAQEVSDWEVRMAWQRPRLGASVGYSRMGAFRPAAYWQFEPVVDTIGPNPATEWVTVGGRVALRPWFTVSGWYREPLANAVPEGAPPGLGYAEAAIRSKFLRTFPSGIFDLKLAISMESWGTGVLGRGPTGEPVVLDGATFLRAQIQMQFHGFIFYLDRFNLSNSKKAYVPGLGMPGNAQTFGVRWTFLN